MSTIILILIIVIASAVLITLIRSRNKIDITPEQARQQIDADLNGVWQCVCSAVACEKAGDVSGMHKFNTMAVNYMDHAVKMERVIQVK